MMRISTLLWVALAGIVGFGLFQLKHRVQELEDDLFRLNRSVLAEEQAIHVLKAEWSYINQPQRLQELASRHLDLQPMKPTQLGSFADLPMRGDEGTALVAAPKAPAPRPTAKAPSVKAASATSLPKSSLSRPAPVAVHAMPVSARQRGEQERR